MTSATNSNGYSMIPASAPRPAVFIMILLPPTSWAILVSGIGKSWVPRRATRDDVRPVVADRLRAERDEDVGALGVAPQRVVGDPDLEEVEPATDTGHVFRVGVQPEPSVAEGLGKPGAAGLHPLSRFSREPERHVVYTSCHGLSPPLEVGPPPPPGPPRG